MRTEVTTVYTTYCKRCGAYYESESLVALSNWNRMHEKCSWVAVSNVGGRQGT
jgi:hypothetical protein